MVSTVKARRRSERDNPQGMLGELSEEKETAYASLHAETTQQANGQERANVDYDRMHHVFFLVPHISRHGRCLCKARSREWRSTSSEGPERAQRFATHPPANRRATHRGPAGASELSHARQVSAADSTDCLVAPATTAQLSARRSLHERESGVPGNAPRQTIKNIARAHCG